MLYDLTLTHQSPFRAGPLPMTGWNCGDPLKAGFVDNYRDSDIRGHSLDAPHMIPGGSVQGLSPKAKPYGLICQSVAWRPGR